MQPSLLLPGAIPLVCTVVFASSASAYSPHPTSGLSTTDSHHAQHHGVVALAPNGCSWNPDTWADCLQSQLNDAKNDAEQAAAKAAESIKQVAELTDELASIKPALSEFSGCTHLLPGDMGDGVFTQLKNLYKNKDALPQFISNGYIEPMQSQTAGYLSSAAQHVATFFMTEASAVMQTLLVNGTLNQTAVSSLATMNGTLSLVAGVAAIDPVMACLMNDGLLKDISSANGHGATTVKAITSRLLNMSMNALVTVWTELTVRVHLEQ